MRDRASENIRITTLTVCGHPSLHWPKEFRVRNCSKKDKVSKKKNKFVLDAPCVSVYDYIYVSKTNDENLF